MNDFISCRPVGSTFLQNITPHSSTLAGSNLLLLVICSLGIGGQVLARDFTLEPMVLEIGENDFPRGHDNNRKSVETEFECFDSVIVLSNFDCEVDNATEGSVLLKGASLRDITFSESNTPCRTTVTAIETESQRSLASRKSTVHRASDWKLEVASVSPRKAELPGCKEVVTLKGAAA